MGIDRGLINVKGQNHLLVASFNGHLKVVQFFLQRHDFDKNSIDAKGNTLLHLAACSGNQELVAWLLSDEGGCSDQINVVNKYGQSPLFSALSNGRLETVQCLFRPEVDHTFVSKEAGDTLLHAACYSSNPEMVEWILDHNLTLSQLVMKNKSGLTPLQVAMNNHESLDVGCYLIEKIGFDYKDESGNTFLYQAVIENNKKLVEWLLSKHKYDLNAENNRGVVPLLAAIDKKNEDIIKLLISKGAKLAYQNMKGESLLHVAVIIGAENAVDWFLSKPSTNVNIQNTSGVTPLYLAILFNHVNIIDTLLVAKANKLIENKNGSSFMHIAAMSGHLNVIEWALKNGFDVDCTSKFDLTPLYLALFYNQSAAVDLLLTCRANKDFKDKDGQGFLHRAALCENQEDNEDCGHLNVMRWMLAQPYIAKNIDLKNGNKLTPLACAVNNGKIKIAQMFLTAGADLHCLDGCNNNLLHLAAYNGQELMIEWLLNNGFGGPECLTKQNRNGHTPYNLVTQFILRRTDNKTISQEMLARLKPAEKSVVVTTKKKK